MIINTTAGKTYAVTPQTDCTVSTPDGVLIASCPAGEQTLFVAPSADVEVSDDAALVTESFKGAPAGLSAVWGSIKKVSASLASKLNVSTFNDHTGNSTVHVTAEDRQRWDASRSMYYSEITITEENGTNGLLIPSDAPSGWYEARVGLSFVPTVDQEVSVYTMSGGRDPVYNWDSYMEEKYIPWYNNIPVPNYAIREPSGLELRYDWADTNASLSDMGCLLYIHHTQGTESPICGVSGAPEDTPNWGRLVVRQLSN